MFYHQREKKVGEILQSQMESLIFQMPLTHYLQRTYPCLEKYWEEHFPLFATVFHCASDFLQPSPVRVFLHPTYYTVIHTALFVKHQLKRCFR